MEDRYIIALVYHLEKACVVLTGQGLHSEIHSLIYSLNYKSPYKPWIWTEY